MGTEERRRIYRREGDGYPSDLSWRYLSRDSFPSRKVRDMCERNDPVMFDNPAMLFGVGIFGFSVPPLKFTRRRASFERVTESAAARHEKTPVLQQPHELCMSIYRQRKIEESSGCGNAGWLGAKTMTLRYSRTLGQ
jgi:hypothetical protein